VRDAVGNELFLHLRHTESRLLQVDLVFLHSMTKFENRAEDLGDLAQG
jgi:hypothetical protein